MAAPVFGGDKQQVKGAIKAEHVKLEGFGSRGAVVQQIQISFERTMNMIYEIGSNDVYYVGDRRRGSIQGNRVVAGSGDFKAMIDTYSDMCEPELLTLKAESNGCGGAGGGNVTYDCQDTVLISIGASVTAQDIVITENVGFQFAELDYT